MFPRVIRIAGIMGGLINTVAAALFSYYVLLPILLPIITKQIEASGVPRDYVDMAVSMAGTGIVVAAILFPVIGWFIISAVLYALLRLFRVRLRFWDSFFTVGNALYVNAISYAIVAAPPILDLMRQSILAGSREPLILLIDLAFTLASSIYASYLVARFGNLGITRVLVPSVIAFMIFYALSLVT